MTTKTSSDTILDILAHSLASASLGAEKEENTPATLLLTFLALNFAANLRHHPEGNRDDADAFLDLLEVKDRELKSALFVQSEPRKEPEPSPKNYQEELEAQLHSFNEPEPESPNEMVGEGEFRSIGTDPVLADEEYHPNEKDQVFEDLRAALGKTIKPVEDDSKTIAILRARIEVLKTGEGERKLLWRNVDIWRKRALDAEATIETAATLSRRVSDVLAESLMQSKIIHPFHDLSEGIPKEGEEDHALKAGTRMEQG